MHTDNLHRNTIHTNNCTPKCTAGSHHLGHISGELTLEEAMDLS
jgi:hypothetical protein